jgi:hypothetical protein
MNAEEARKKLEDKRKLQQVGMSTIAPNPAHLTLKWSFFNEEVKIDGGRTANLPSGAFQFQEKQQDGTWKRHKITQKMFAMAIIDHTTIQINGSEFDGQRMVRSYWSNEMRMSDVMTTPFILKIKGADKEAKAKSFVGSYKDLKDMHDIKGRMHVIYGVTPQGKLVKLVLPYYSYSLGTDKFQTHGDTFLDADKKSSKGGFNNCLLTYDGFHELKNGSTTYTSPKFKFEETMNDEMIVLAAEASDILDSWYAEYHASNLSSLARLEGKAPDESYQGASKHGSENQAAAAPTSEAAEVEYEEEEEDSIPF